MLPHPLNVYAPTYHFTVCLKVASLVRQDAFMLKYIVLLINLFNFDLIFYAADTLALLDVN